jgi:hypothetical protein
MAEGACRVASACGFGWTTFGLLAEADGADRMEAGAGGSTAARAALKSASSPKSSSMGLLRVAEKRWRRRVAGGRVAKIVRGHAAGIFAR